MGIEHLEFVFNLEKTFSITVSDDERVLRLVTAGDAFDLVSEKLRIAGREIDPDALWLQLTAMILATGTFLDNGNRIVVKRETKLIDDLGWG
jgi:hypothetical protein